MTARNPQFLAELVRAIVPPLTRTAHKGQAGRIGVVGGSREYTGAPYYAAITALKVGADLSFVFCTENAATPIKSYSPELIVVPALNSADPVGEVSKYRLHTLVVGPGLGRDEAIQETVKGIVESARQDSLAMVFDADGIALLLKYPSLIQNYSKAIITPNVAEFSRLCQSMLGKPASSYSSNREACQALSKKLGNVTIVCKGPVDIITNGEESLVCDVEGSLRRCGGQGDVLSGSLGTLLHWASSTRLTDHDIRPEVRALMDRLGPNMAAAYAGCALARCSSNLAFAAHRRSMTAPNLIEQLQSAFERTFEEETAQ